LHLISGQRLLRPLDVVPAIEEQVRHRATDSLRGSASAIVLCFPVTSTSGVRVRLSVLTERIVEPCAVTDQMGGQSAARSLRLQSAMA
jgi:hypothetical protein